MEREGLALLEALDQAEWVAAGPYTPTLSGGTPGGSAQFAGIYPGVRGPGRCIRAGEIVLNGYSSDVVNSNIRLLGSRSCLDNSGEAGRRGPPPREQGPRAQVTPAPFGQIIATPVGPARRASARLSKRRDAAGDYRLHPAGLKWGAPAGTIKARFPGVPLCTGSFADELVYGKYMICVDAVTGDLRWND